MCRGVQFACVLCVYAVVRVRVSASVCVLLSFSAPVWCRVCGGPVSGQHANQCVRCTLTCLGNGLGETALIFELREELSALDVVNSLSIRGDQGHRAGG